MLFENRTYRQVELPYVVDGARYFNAIAPLPWSVYLDSCGNLDLARFDIMSAEPVVQLVTNDGITECRSASAISVRHENPFELVRSYVQQIPKTIHSDLPFYAGAMGYFGYDLARHDYKLPSQRHDKHAYADMMFGIYSWAIVIDHHARRCTLAGFFETDKALERVRHMFRDLPELAEAATEHVCEAFKANMSAESYAERFERVQGYIREGDCYQVNLAQAFSAEITVSPWPLYRSLRAQNPAPFSAFLNYPALAVLSSSPERFLQVTGGQVTTSPIKGTRPRGNTRKDDDLLASELLSSDKDRAENLMIVDLLRNDLGKNCTYGSIRVPELFKVQHFPTVHHLVSTITGKLRSDRHALDLLRGCFPGGSITGAPKQRAMQIIDELEPDRRGVYCGSIGYISADGNMDTNIVIRTMIMKEGKIGFHAGGGIVADSDPESEYRETLDKASAFMKLLGQL